MRAQHGNLTADRHVIAYKQELQCIMELSDPEMVHKYDELVDEYNRELPRIQQDGDLDALKDFLQRANNLVI